LPFFGGVYLGYIMTEVIWICFAYIMGLLATRIGLPSLIGYLGAGFAIFVFGGSLGLPETSGDSINHLAHIGVLLLLFTVGLKLNVKKVMKSEVIGTGILHCAISAIIFGPVIYYVTGVDWSMAFFLAMALSFSSTVLAAKSLESKNELKAFHGRVAIGILIIQDLIAMSFMSFSSGVVPSVWAFGVLALPLLTPFFFKILDWSGHDEMLVLGGLFLALVVGGAGFHSVGLSGELGALVVGALIASHDKASELSEKLWSLKEVFLIGFFLSIGMNGLPDTNSWIFALTVVALLPLQGVVFFFLLVGFKLKARSAFLTTTSLLNFSEFGLIVAAVVMPEWTIPLALAVSLSFVLSAPLNRFSHPIFDRLEKYLVRFERKGFHPDEEPISLGDAQILIMGLGRVGRPAYKAITRTDKKVIGLDSDQDKVARLIDAGYNARYADAEHGNFWSTLDLSGLESCILCMNCPEASKIAARKLRQYGYKGYIVSHTMHKDEKKAIKDAGANEVYLTMNEAGESLAGHVVEGVVPVKVSDTARA
jgi:predicted Kef-type K+ transport protein